jgi:ABC-type enterochelin transport system substrate-binding protein
LGFKEAVKIVENAEEILAILQQIKKGENEVCTADVRALETITEIRIKPTITASSDSIVISFPEKLFNDTVSLRHAVIEILNITQQLANFLILKGFLL